MPVKTSGAFHPRLDPMPVYLQITIHASGSTYIAQLIDEAYRSFPIPIPQTHDDMKSLNDSLQLAVQKVSDTLRQGANYEEALRQLARRGNFAFNSIFDTDSAQNAIRDALEAGKGRVVQIVTKDFFIPWDLLYDGPDPRGAAITINDLWQGFWGANYIISRVIDQNERPAAHLSPFLATLLPRVGLIATDTKNLPYVWSHEIPALKKYDGKKIALKILDDLSNDKRDLGWTQLRQFFKEEWHFLHFACHNYPQIPIEDSYLSVAKDFSIPMIDFRNSRFDLPYHPFVILNACRTDIMNPLYTSSWVHLFWKSGARGVLATDFKVRDDFAAAFSTYLYRDLLKGIPIGYALMNVRTLFWDKQNNPLGLAYALYSSPSIKVVKPRAQ